MQITPMSPVITEPSTPTPSDQIETLYSMCDWWKAKDTEHMPDICHWFRQPEQNVFNIDKMSSKSHFTPFGHLPNQDHPHVYHSSSVSLMLILGGVFLILFITAVITCIKQKRGAQSWNEEAILNTRISNHLRRMNTSSISLVLEGSYPVQQSDSPPDYDAAVKAKDTEAEELPSYSEAVTNKDPGIPTI
eukprot:TRINITY_DN23450_c0_g1_i5.p1 TRINITY_DN23450_c0_g1~~TRINITY_DN23450_c0_g1_i5.p1  ORF type:complete len:190 (-),score=35.25 TRINITY_DN23450_c0_g1_i5:110-679(-)